MRDYAETLPVLLDLDLYRAGWNGILDSYPGIPVKQLALQSLRKSLLKKFEDLPSKAADDAALNLFLEVNERCRLWSLDTSRMTEVDAIVVGEAKKFLHRFFYPEFEQVNCILSPSSISDGFGFGPGASIGSSSTDFVSKVGTSSMSATNPGLYMLYAQAISNDPIWSDVESVRLVKRGVDIVRGSRLSFVPKSVKISRTICTEPLLNMLFQKGIEAVLVKQLRKVVGIDFSKQQHKNRLLAQLGSKTGRFGTIDLSSASDSMSLGLVEEFFPRQVVSWLKMTRSEVTVLPDGTEVTLHMVSSMGNAFTFPLQTLFFTSLVYGVYKAYDMFFDRPYGHSLGSFAVYGDDIIVHREAYDLLCRTLVLCGFRVNADKSFNEGFFRESCGGDYYHGQNVRGVYIRTLKHVHDNYSAINRLNVWSAEMGVLLPETIQYLLKGCRILPVPLDEMDVAGIKIPLRSVKLRKVNKYTGGIMYRYVHLRPLEFDVSDVELRPPKLRGWVNNPSAVLMAALAGSLRRSKVAIRRSRPLTSIRVRYSSSWDYITPALGVSREFGERWKSFFELNLNLL
jgi:hypothetical protein